MPSNEPVVVRRASAADLEGIVRLQNDQNGVECEAPIRAFMTDPAVGIEAFTVADAGGEVVSSLCLLPKELAVDGIDLPCAEVGYVATDPRFAGQGLVRRQMELVHEWSRERGDLVQLIAGIAYFYRQFAYEYAIAMPRVGLVVPHVPKSPLGWSARAATPDDIDDVIRLQELAYAAASVVGRQSRGGWLDRLATEEASGVLVAEHAGRIHGVATTGDGPPGVSGVSFLGALAVDTDAAVWALLAAAARSGKPVAVERRPGTFADSVVGWVCADHPREYAWYVRVADPVATLDRLRPAFGARLAASTMPKSSVRLVVSLFRSTVVLTIESGEVTRVEGGPPDQRAVAHGGAAVPPDLFATLLFGRHGASGLAARHDDVELGGTAPLMNVLFPRRVADLRTG